MYQYLLIDIEQYIFLQSLCSINRLLFYLVKKYLNQIFQGAKVMIKKSLSLQKHRSISPFENSEPCMDTEKKFLGTRVVVLFDLRATVSFRKTGREFVLLFESDACLFCGVF